VKIAEYIKHKEHQLRRSIKLPPRASISFLEKDKGKGGRKEKERKAKKDHNYKGISTPIIYRIAKI